jgi:hypothetical protein
LFMNVLVQESLLQVGFPSTDWRIQKDTVGVIRDASSALWGWHGSIRTPQSKRRSRQYSLQGKWWPLFLGCSRSSFGWFHSPGSTINAAAYQETLKETNYSAQESRIVDHKTLSSSFVWQYSTSQCCHNCESLDLLGLGNSSTSTIQSWFGVVGLPSIPRDEKAPQRSSLPLQWRCSKWSKEMVSCPECSFSMKNLKNLYITMISVWTDLVTMWRSKANMRLYLSLMSYSVCCYFI